MNKILMLLALPCAVSFLSSCRCGGCDSIYTTTGAELTTQGTLIDLADGDPKAVLSVTGNLVISKGDRRCMNKDLKVCMHDGLDTAKLALVCNRELRLESGIIPAGNNLLRQRNIIKQEEYSPMAKDLLTIVLRPGNSFDTGTYTFILSGATKDGVAIRDTGFISCR